MHGRVFSIAPTVTTKSVSSHGPVSPGSKVTPVWRTTGLRRIPPFASEWFRSRHGTHFWPGSHEERPAREFLECSHWLQSKGEQALTLPRRGNRKHVALKSTGHEDNYTRCLGCWEAQRTPLRAHCTSHSTPGVVISPGSPLSFQLPFFPFDAFFPTHLFYISSVRTERKCVSPPVGWDLA